MPAHNIMPKSIGKATTLNNEAYVKVMEFELESHDVY